jgi:tripartite-type tricarboxylate transporter receptor subunit TctC
MRVIIPFAPGGSTDILGRVIAQRLNEKFKVPVVADNRPGANGTLGTLAAVKAPADGHTLLIVPAGFAGNPMTYKNLPYDQTRDLAPVSQLVAGPLTLTVHPSLPAKTARDLIGLAKARPGEITFGSSGTGSLNQLAAEWFAMSAGIKMIHVTYRGGGAGVIDLMSGQISLYFMNALQSLPYIKSGRLRALGVTTPQRSPFAPEIPAIAESGLPGYDMTTWTALLVTGGTPREVVNKLHAEVALILNQPETKERLAADGMAVVASTPAQFTEFLARESTKYARIIQAAGITAAQ